jgi:hypothetical protein
MLLAGAGAGADGHGVTGESDLGTSLLTFPIADGVLTARSGNGFRC